MFFFHLRCVIADSDATARDISVSDKRRGREEHRVSAQAALLRFVTLPATLIPSLLFTLAHTYQTLLINLQTLKKQTKKPVRRYLEDLRVYLEMSLRFTQWWRFWFYSAPILVFR